MRKFPGCKGFNLDYKSIAKEYLAGNQLKDLAIKYNISTWTLLDNFKKLGIKKNTKRYQNDNFFSEYNKESCYWAGFIAADGWVTENQIGIELSQRDRDHLENFVKILKGNVKIGNRDRRGFKYSSIHINSKQMIKDLKNNFNIIPNKSLILKPPVEMPKEYIIDFLRGYFDGDGSIGWHKYNNIVRFVICSGSKEFLKWITEYIKDEYNINIRIKNVKLKNLYTISTSGKYARKIFKRLYKNSGPNLRLERKYNEYIRFQKKYTENIKNGEVIKKEINYNIEKCFYNNLSIEEISKELNISVYRIRKLIKDNSLKRNLIKDKLRNRNKQIYNMFLKTKKINNVAKHFGLDKSSCYKIIKELT